MKIVLVGPEIEENLGLRYLAGALRDRGDDADIVAFDHPHEIAEVAAAVARRDVDVIGLSMMFQLRAREFVVLAERIRAAGFTGTLIAGGQHATFMADEILADNPAFDAIVLGDGEAPLAELVDALRAGGSLLAVPGLVVRTDDGAVVRTACREGRTDLTALPRPVRDPHPRLHMGLPTAPMIASRGCYASCTFCSIAAWEKLSGGPRYRVRPPEHIAREMAELYRERGVRVFNFHDDNFWFPKVEANRERLAELARALRAHRVGDIALLFKCRPCDVDPELFAQARDMGMVRIYVGIETDAPAGLLSLRRGVSQPQNQRALDVLASLDVHACSNLLLFDPDTRLPDIAHNIEFLERNARHTLNFCRVEPYGGTPLTRRLAGEGRLVGDYLGFDYSLREPRVELLWRIAHVAFHDRNFPADGLANTIIGMAYRFHLAKRFWPGPELEALRAPVEDFVLRFNREQAALLRRAYDFAASCDLADRDAAVELASELAVRVRTSDARLVPECDALIAALERHASRRGAGGSTGRLGEGAAGSGWWHLGAPLASLALAACVSHADADNGRFAKPPAGHGKPAVTLACSRDGKTEADLVKTDAASAKLVADAKPQPIKNGWTTPGPDVEGTLQFSPMISQGNGCGGGGFYGWRVEFALSGPAAADYELDGLAGWITTPNGTISRAADDHWVRLSLPNPGKVTTNRIGAIFRKRGAPDAPPLVVAGDVPPDPTPPPPADYGRHHMGCDPVPSPIAMQPPLDTNRIVHFALETSSVPMPGQLEMRTWIDPAIQHARLVGKPKITSELGTVTLGGYTGASGEYAALGNFMLDLRCADGKIVPHKFKVRATWHLAQHGRVQTYSGTVELELTPDGTVAPATPASPKHGMLEELPLGRRYAGTIEAVPASRGHALRARAPHGVHVLGARWHALGGTMIAGDDPLAIELRPDAGEAGAVCVMELADGLCIATWSRA